jgi:hypothetical protein
MSLSIILNPFLAILGPPDGRYDIEGGLGVNGFGERATDKIRAQVLF